MARIRDNRALRGSGFRPEAADEPQVILRKDTTEEFDETRYYGRRPKVELFWRLGVSGRWDYWEIEPWDLPIPAYSDDAGAYAFAGWVARLFSGNAWMEGADSVVAERNRCVARNRAIKEFIDMLDRRASGGGFDA